jgi:hypothetical protein
MLPVMLDTFDFHIAITILYIFHRPVFLFCKKTDRTVNNVQNCDSYTRARGSVDVWNRVQQARRSKVSSLDGIIEFLQFT